MTLVHEIRKTVTDTTPVYAAVGVTDLAVEKVRDARDRAVAARADLQVSALQDKAIKRAEKVAERVAEQAQHVPALALNQTLEAASKAHQTYSELAIRGHKLVTRLRNQKTTQDLIAQAGSTVTIGKGAVTTVRKAAVDTQRAAKATLTTGRHDAEAVVEAVVDAVVDAVRPEIKVATTPAPRKAAKATRPSARATRPSTKATRTSVKRTATVAKKSTASTKRVAKSVATSSAKTATAAAEVIKSATPTVEVTPTTEVTPKAND